MPEMFQEQRLPTKAAIQAEIKELEKQLPQVNIEYFCNPNDINIKARFESMTKQHMQYHSALLCKMYCDESWL